jgi:hypothetical protein
METSVSRILHFSVKWPQDRRLDRNEGSSGRRREGTNPWSSSQRPVTSKLTPWTRNQQSLSWSTNFSASMEPHGSWYSSQTPTTGSYPEPDQFNSHLQVLFIKKTLFIFPFHLRPGLFSGSPTKILYVCIFNYTCLAHLNLLYWSF